MATYLITYDLNNETTRPPIVKKIKALANSQVRLSESSYAISTTDSAQDIFDALRGLLDENDVLYVINLKRPRVGRGPQKVTQWLKDNLS